MKTENITTIAVLGLVAFILYQLNKSAKSLAGVGTRLGETAYGAVQTVTGGGFQEVYNWMVGVPTALAPKNPFARGQIPTSTALALAEYEAWKANPYPSAADIAAFWKGR